MNKHPSYHGGRKALPYLLSTTKTLARCELYYADPKAHGFSRGMMETVAN